MLPLLKGKSRLSLEMIEYQSADFGSDMEAIVSRLQAKIEDKTYKNDGSIEDSAELRDFKRLIFSRLGLQVDVITDSAPAAVLPFYSNKNHVFLDEFFRGGFSIRGQEKILRKAQGKNGTVNTHKAKVSGIFSEYENLLYMNFYELFTTFKMTTPEVVAVTLHELGHAFYACEYADRLETNNQILANVALEMSSSKEKKDVVYVYRELQKVNPKTTEEEVDKLLYGNRVIAGYVWFRAVVGSVEGQMSNEKYSQTSFEQMADNFAARFGYGRQMLVAQEKMHGHLGSIETSKNWMAFVNFMQTLQFLGSIFFAGMAALSGMLPISLFMGVIAFLLLRMSGDDVKDYTYHELKVRYKRIRHEYVQVLKTIKLSDDKLTLILKDIERMDRSIQETHRFDTVLRVASNFIFKGDRDADRSIREQQLLEELVHSDLFVVSAKLKLASQG